MHQVAALHDVLRELSEVEDFVTARHTLEKKP